MTAEELIAKVKERLPTVEANRRVDKNLAVIDVAADSLPEILATLQGDESFGFDLLMDMTAVDWPKRSPRFDLVYHLYSTKHNHRLRLKVALADGEHAPSATKLWKIADWFERELWDLYGIKFSGHPNLKRLLLYEEFKGHPLRKDYPYDKRQPLEPETWPSLDSQVKIEGLKIHRP